MPNVQITTQVSTDELLHSVSSLPAQELDNFVSKVLAIQAKLKAPSLSAQETQLLSQANSHLDENQQQRWNTLEAKRQQDTLTETERQDLITLNDIAEQKNVERMAALAKLAQLRQISLPDLMKQLGIKPPSYV